MLAVTFRDRKVVLDDVAPPSGEGVLVNVKGCGICGSDVMMLDSGFPIRGIPGHEIAGELEDGTPVAIEPIAPPSSYGRLASPSGPGPPKTSRPGMVPADSIPFPMVAARSLTH